ncbi:fibronectin type III and SPRY domain-containing protein 2-like [Rana temporaria]|uniref:fibronectin type III and SPRY domain-containing protein 2-like n=1 Tax=Rana temporaria TaxID=8407 RepID=UPI001AAD9E07|nr:fibronectin type III and SPRY domain-containing protein 2-like [Rana temporaria]
MPGVNVEKCTGTYVYPHSTTRGKGHINAEPSRRCPQPTQAIQPSRRYPQPSPTIQPSRRYPQPSSTIQPSRRYPQPSPTIQPSRRYPQPSPTIQHSHRQAGGPNILSDIMCGVNVQKCADTEVYPHSSAKEMLPFLAKPSWKHPETASTIQHSHRQAGGPNIKSVQQTSRVADIFWDLSTASNHLHISDDGKTVYKSPYKLFPETLWCFRCSQVMSITSFSSGRHYWQVDAGESPIWKVGMCYTSIDRRGFQSGLGCNNKSWCLEKRKFNEYSFVHDSYQYPLPGGISSNRVRIDLDYEAGRISFYDLCNPIQHLHTFTTTFTEPLHAAMRVGKNSCIRIIGGEYKGKNLYRDW